MSEIEGLSELLGKLKKLEGIGKNTDALLAGAFVIEKHAKQNAPVLTGALRASIMSRKVEGGAEVSVGVDYGYEQEFGTSQMAGKGYLRRAIDENQDEVVKAVAEQLAKDIEKLGG